LEPNTDYSFPATFGSSSNSFFRNLGAYPCLTIEHRQQKKRKTLGTAVARSKRPNPAPMHSDHDLQSSIYDALMPWTKWKEHGDLKQMVVPHVEGWSSRADQH